METTVKNTLNNENGMIMVFVLIILVIVTLLGLTASRTAVTEIMIATNERRYVNELCNAEGGLISALETPITSPMWWLTDAFLSADPTTPAATFIDPAVDFNGDGNVDATVEIRCIESTGTAVAGLSAAANNVPVIRHTGPPPPNSGYDLSFEIHRYAVTATSLTGNTQVQAGVWKAFNKPT